LLTAFNTASLYLPFAKVVHAFEMRQFQGYDFVNDNALTDDEDIQSTTKQKATKIDSVFIIFHPNDKSKVICIKPLISNFKLTAEGADAQKYPTDEIVMRILNDHIQYQMLLDALNFSSNSMI
jgi:hypothetical protein